MLANLNLNHLRIFHVVYETKSMTKAAQKLFLTQSGVSQHVKNLEDTLSITLFDRVGRMLIPTHSAQNLYSECKNSMESLHRALQEITDGTPAGSISISAPPEFAHNILAPILAELRKKFPSIIIHLQVGLASQMMSKLLSGEQDIAFMDDFVLDSRLETRSIFDETLQLCVKRSLLKKFPKEQRQKALPADLPLLAYLPGEPVLRKWHKHHFNRSPSRLNVVAYLSNSQNIARLICLGIGAGIITCHHLSELKTQGHDLLVIKPKRTPLLNPISMNRVKHRSASRIETLVTDFLFDRFASIKKPTNSSVNYCCS